MYYQINEKKAKQAKEMMSYSDYVDGRFETREYEDKQGMKRKAYEVVVREVNFCAFKRNEETDIDLLDVSNEDLPF